MEQEKFVLFKLFSDRIYEIREFCTNKEISASREKLNTLLLGKDVLKFNFEKCNVDSVFYTFNTSMSWTHLVEKKKHYCSSSSWKDYEKCTACKFAILISIRGVQDNCCLEIEDDKTGAKTPFISGLEVTNRTFDGVGVEGGSVSFEGKDFVGILDDDVLRPEIVHSTPSYGSSRLHASVEDLFNNYIQRYNKYSTALVKLSDAWDKDHSTNLKARRIQQEKAVTLFFEDSSSKTEGNNMINMDLTPTAKIACDLFNKFVDFDTDEEHLLVNCCLAVGLNDSQASRDKLRLALLEMRVVEYDVLAGDHRSTIDRLIEVAITKTSKNKKEVFTILKKQITSKIIEALNETCPVTLPPGLYALKDKYLAQILFLTPDWKNDLKQIALRKRDLLNASKSEHGAMIEKEHESLDRERGGILFDAAMYAPFFKFAKAHMALVACHLRLCHQNQKAEQGKELTARKLSAIQELETKKVVRKLLEIPPPSSNEDDASSSSFRIFEFCDTDFKDYIEGLPLKESTPLDLDVLLFVLLNERCSAAAKDLFTDVTDLEDLMRKLKRLPEPSKTEEEILEMKPSLDQLPKVVSVKGALEKCFCPEDENNATLPPSKTLKTEKSSSGNGKQGFDKKAFRQMLLNTIKNYFARDYLPQMHEFTRLKLIKAIESWIERNGTTTDSNSAVHVEELPMKQKKETSNETIEIKEQPEIETLFFLPYLEKFKMRYTSNKELKKEPLDALARIKREQKYNVTIQVMERFDPKLYRSPDSFETLSPLFPATPVNDDLCIEVLRHGDDILASLLSDIGVTLGDDKESKKYNRLLVRGAPVNECDSSTIIAELMHHRIWSDIIFLKSNQVRDDRGDLLIRVIKSLINIIFQAPADKRRNYVKQVSAALAPEFILSDMTETVRRTQVNLTIATCTLSNANIEEVKETIDTSNIAITVTKVGKVGKVGKVDKVDNAKPFPVVGAETWETASCIARRVLSRYLVSCVALTKYGNSTWRATGKQAAVFQSPPPYCIPVDAGRDSEYFELGPDPLAQLWYWHEKSMRQHSTMRYEGDGQAKRVMSIQHIIRERSLYGFLKTEMPLWPFPFDILDAIFQNLEDVERLEVQKNLDRRNDFCIYFYGVLHKSFDAETKYVVWEMFIDLSTLFTLVAKMRHLLKKLFPGKRIYSLNSSQDTMDVLKSMQEMTALSLVPEFRAIENIVNIHLILEEVYLFRKKNKMFILDTSPLKLFQLHRVLLLLIFQKIHKWKAVWNEKHTLDDVSNEKHTLDDFIQYLVPLVEEESGDLQCKEMKKEIKYLGMTNILFDHLFVEEGWYKRETIWAIESLPIIQDLEVFPIEAGVVRMMEEQYHVPNQEPQLEQRKQDCNILADVVLLIMKAFTVANSAKTDIKRFADKSRSLSGQIFKNNTDITSQVCKLFGYMMDSTIECISDVKVEAAIFTKYLFMKEHFKFLPGVKLDCDVKCKYLSRRNSTRVNEEPTDMILGELTLFNYDPSRQFKFNDETEVQSNMKTVFKPEYKHIKLGEQTGKSFRHYRPTCFGQYWMVASMDVSLGVMECLRKVQVAMTSAFSQKAMEEIPKDQSDCFQEKFLDDAEYKYFLEFFRIESWIKGEFKTSESGRMKLREFLQDNKLEEIASSSEKMVPLAACIKQLFEAKSSCQRQQYSDGVIDRIQVEFNTKGRPKYNIYIRFFKDGDAFIFANWANRNQTEKFTRKSLSMPDYNSLDEKFLLDYTDFSPSFCLKAFAMRTLLHKLCGMKVHHELESKLDRLGQPAIPSLESVPEQSRTAAEKEQHERFKVFVGKVFSVISCEFGKMDKLTSLVRLGVGMFGCDKEIGLKTETGNQTLCLLPRIRTDFIIVQTGEGLINSKRGLNMNLRDRCKIWKVSFDEGSWQLRDVNDTIQETQGKKLINVFVNPLYGASDVIHSKTTSPFQGIVDAFREVLNRGYEKLYSHLFSSDQKMEKSGTMEKLEEIQKSEAEIKNECISGAKRFCGSVLRLYPKFEIWKTLLLDCQKNPNVSLIFKLLREKLTEFEKEPPESPIDSSVDPLNLIPDAQIDKDAYYVVVPKHLVRHFPI